MDKMGGAKYSDQRWRDCPRFGSAVSNRLRLSGEQGGENAVPTLAKDADQPVAATLRADDGKGCRPGFRLFGELVTLTKEPVPSVHTMPWND